MRICTFRRTIAALAASVLCATTHAQIARLDDSTSPRAMVSADFRQAQMVDAQTISLPFGRIEYRLATAAYIGKQARIYYVIPLAIQGLRSPSGMQVQWRGNGSFQSGAGYPGERVLVWNGVIRSAWISEFFDLTLRIEQRQLQISPGGRLAFESYFEIEIQP